MWAEFETFYGVQVDEYTGEFQGGHVPDPHGLWLIVTSCGHEMRSIAPFNLRNTSRWACSTNCLKFRIFEAVYLLLGDRRNFDCILLFGILLLPKVIHILMANVLVTLNICSSILGHLFLINIHSLRRFLIQINLIDMLKGADLLCSQDIVEDGLTIV